MCVSNCEYIYFSNINFGFVINGNKLYIVINCKYLIIIYAYAYLNENYIKIG